MLKFFADFTHKLMSFVLVLVLSTMAAVSHVSPALAGLSGTPSMSKSTASTPTSATKQPSKSPSLHDGDAPSSVNHSTSKKEKREQIADARGQLTKSKNKHRKRSMAHKKSSHKEGGTAL
jgi:hypothetical protein